MSWVVFVLRIPRVSSAADPGSGRSCAGNANTAQLKYIFHDPMEAEAQIDDLL